MIEKSAVLSRLVPKLYRRHRGFALVALGITWAHVFGALDELLPGTVERHQPAVFVYQQRLATPAIWGAVHVVAAALMVFGIYRARADLFLVRLSSALSATVFLLLTISFLLAAVAHWPAASLLGTGTCGFVTFACVAAVLEPGVQRATREDDS